MAKLTQDDYTRIAQSARKIVQTIFDSFDIGESLSTPKITPGVVSAVVDALEQEFIVSRKRQASVHPTVAPIAMTTSKKASHENGAAAETVPVSHREAPAPSNVTWQWPWDLAKTARALDAGRMTWRTLDLDRRRRFIYHMVRQLVDHRGYVTMPKFDNNRPEWMSTAAAQCLALDLSWSQLIAAAREAEPVTAQDNGAG